MRSDPHLRDVEHETTVAALAACTVDLDQAAADAVRMARGLLDADNGHAPTCQRDCCAPRGVVCVDDQCGQPWPCSFAADALAVIERWSP